jgi:hypothetical protein
MNDHENMKMRQCDHTPVRFWLAAGCTCVVTMALTGGPVVAPSIASGQTEVTGTQPAQWRLVWTSDPATEALVSWSTRDPGQRHVVTFHSHDGSEKGTVSAESGPYRGSAGKLHYHHARLRDLSPGTRYHVTMQSDDRKSPQFWFLTANSEDQKISLIFGGDSRTDIKSRRDVNRLIAQLVEKHPEIIGFAHGGDYIASGGNLQQWSQWLSDHELTVTAQRRLLPIIPARGNHDPGEIFNQAFGFPDHDHNYYSVSLGPQVRLVTLNTNFNAGGDQRKWLADQLAASRPRYRWLLAQYHRPAYPAVKTPGSSRQHWVPLFEQHNVDLVCEADGHVIKRTVPIRKDRPDPTGVVYVGEGGLGAPQRQPLSDCWYLKSPGMASRGHHVQLITFSENELVHRFIRLSGESIDTYRRSPRNSSN